MLCVLGYGLHRRAREARLVRLWPEQLAHDPAMLSFAVSLARPIYAAHCAGCHGADRSGNRANGAPSLADSVWLYGDGGIGDIENTILYGIRSGHPKAHNVTDMPAEGRSQQLSSAEVDDVAEFVLALSRQPHDEAAAARGRGLFYDKGNCFDCHARDALGSTDYGSPSLLGPSWIYGGDRQTLRQTIYNGRHGLCPAWIDRLTPTQIRALAAFLYVASQPASRLAAR
ncbi:MAG: c-type cytochrome [Steroidobacteraceae bacterium]